MGGTISGGTAPYTLTVVLSNNFGATSSTTFAWPSSGTWSRTSQFAQAVFTLATLTVIDAQGCVANATQICPPFMIWTPQVTTSPDCVQGRSRLRWSGAWELLVGQNPCTPPTHYILDNGPVLPIAGNWTSIGSSGQYLEYNQSIAAGPHTLSVFPNYDCPTTIDCYDNAFFTAPNWTTPASDCGVNIGVRAFLQGALPSGTVMHDSLRTQAAIPTVEPYSALGYQYANMDAGATIVPSMLNVTGNDAIVDWVVVELRSRTSPYAVLFSRPALLQRDGDVVDLDGDANVNFPQAGVGNYRVALRHRNHFGLMTSSSPGLNADGWSVDFRSSSTGCYGTEPRVQVGTAYCLWSGDANGDGVLKYTGASNDRDPILTAISGTTPNNTLGPVYDRRDTNLDGVIKYTGAGNDRDIILTNVGSTTPNNTRTQQLP